MFGEARRDNMLVQAIGDELVVYDRTVHRAHRLNHTAACVWNHCDGKTSVATLAEQVATECNVPSDEGLVWLALERLGKAGLLVAPVTAAQDARGRRRALRRIGKAAAATLLMPVVASLTAPTPAMAQSGPCVHANPFCTGGPGCGGLTCNTNADCVRKGCKECHAIC